MAEAYIYDAVRTPRGRGKAEVGAMSGLTPLWLLRGVPGFLRAWQSGVPGASGSTAAPVASSTRSAVERRSPARSSD